MKLPSTFTNQEAKDGMYHTVDSMKEDLQRPKEIQNYFQKESMHEHMSEKEAEKVRVFMDAYYKE